MNDVMDLIMTDAEKLRANAELVVQTFRESFDADIGFDRAGIEFLDDYIRSVKEELPESAREGTIDTLGSFVGECILQTYGGRWIEVMGWWGILLTTETWVCPFKKVGKLFEPDNKQSLLGFFDIVPVLHLLGDPEE